MGRVNPITEMTIPQNIYEYNSGLQTEINKNKSAVKNLVVALSVKEVTSKITEVEYNVGINIGTDESPIENITIQSINEDTAYSLSKSSNDITGTLNIPTYINEQPLTSIEDFSELQNVTNVIVPQTVESINESCLVIVLH